MHAKVIGVSGPDAMGNYMVQLIMTDSNGSPNGTGSITRTISAGSLGNFTIGAMYSYTETKQ